MSVQRLHPIQERLLKLAQNRNLSGLSLREMGDLVGDRSPQKIKHHLGQLEKKGLLSIDRTKGVISSGKQGWTNGLLGKGRRLLRIPIVGAANCGPAELLADQNVVGYLRVSSTLLHRRTGKGLFAVRADGFSMNKARVEGQTIADGDLVVFDSADCAPKEGDVILSVIDGAANIKRYHADRENDQVVLISDSTEDFAPIHLHPSDDFLVNGKAVRIIKRPKKGLSHE